MPEAPRGKRVVDQTMGRFTVVGTSPSGQAQPYFDRTRGVWVASWRRLVGKVGKPMGRTRALAEASRDRHIEKANDDARPSRLSEGFHAQLALVELIRWWLDHIARRRVRVTTWATYSKQLKLVEGRLTRQSVPLTCNLGRVATERHHRGDPSARCTVASTTSTDVDTGSADATARVRSNRVNVPSWAVTPGSSSQSSHSSKPTSRVVTDRTPLGHDSSSIKNPPRTFGGAADASRSFEESCQLAGSSGDRRRSILPSI